ncbi:uncharacterized protein CCOS01_09967 [Colletotrichum costaricense]|uniref:Uncharacterized protein n=1 Tax=Colletotrichum costaricense TaxID=1209916 RepID=A0AAI9YSQ4_9PEZI|nr:uncharacterized protein CCOS01_09967 [Colletotrichum costaricense]KAK1522255.1 hypothetical protein CCOS01_09967 [Colletotrichum costaricense]
MPQLEMPTPGTQTPVMPTLEQETQRLARTRTPPTALPTTPVTMPATPTTTTTLAMRLMKKTLPLAMQATPPMRKTPPLEMATLLPMTRMLLPATETRTQAMRTLELETQRPARTRMLATPTTTPVMPAMPPMRRTPRQTTETPLMKKMLPPATATLLTRTPLPVAPRTTGLPTPALLPAVLVRARLTRRARPRPLATAALSTSTPRATLRAAVPPGARNFSWGAEESVFHAAAGGKGDSDDLDNPKGAGDDSEQTGGPKGTGKGKGKGKNRSKGKSSSYSSRKGDEGGNGPGKGGRPDRSGDGLRVEESPAMIGRPDGPGSGLGFAELSEFFEIRCDE